MAAFEAAGVRAKRRRRVDVVRRTVVAPSREHRHRPRLLPEAPDADLEAKLRPNGHVPTAGAPDSVQHWRELRLQDGDERASYLDLGFVSSSCVVRQPPAASMRCHAALNLSSALPQAGLADRLPRASTRSQRKHFRELQSRSCVPSPRASRTRTVRRPPSAPTRDGHEDYPGGGDGKRDGPRLYGRPSASSDTPVADSPSTASRAPRPRSPSRRSARHAARAASGHVFMWNMLRHAALGRPGGV